MKHDAVSAVLDLAAHDGDPEHVAGSVGRVAAALIDPVLEHIRPAASVAVAEPCRPERVSSPTVNSTKPSPSFSVSLDVAPASSHPSEPAVFWSDPLTTARLQAIRPSPSLAAGSRTRSDVLP